jgi:hypothetical protein
MKTFIILAGLILFGLSGYSQVSDEIYLFTINNDTMTITKSNNISDIAIAVPTASTDSCKLDGSGKVIDGIATNGFLIAPGEDTSISARRRIKYLRIIARSGSYTRVIARPSE